MGKILITVAMLLALAATFAHEGHNKTPGALSAPHGGLVQGTEHLYVELVVSKEVVQLYFYDHDMKTVQAQTVKVEGKTILPKKSGSLPVTFSVEKDSFSAKINSKGAHRYTLELTVSHAGKNEKVQFTVEPQ